MNVMEVSKIVEIKSNENYKRDKQSPIRTLLKLTGNSKSIKTISNPKKEVKPTININHNNKLTKVSSMKNVNQNYFNLNNTKNKNECISIPNNNENYNYTNNNNIIFKKINNINKKVKNHKNIITNCISNNKNINNNYETKKNQIIVKKIKYNKNKKLKIGQNNECNERLQKKMVTFDNNNKKNEKLSFNCSIYDKCNRDIKKDNITFFNSRLEISSKKDEKRKKIFPHNNNNNILYIKNQKKIEHLDTNRNTSCINFYNKYLKNNCAKKVNIQNYETINHNENNIKGYNDMKVDVIRAYSTINNEEFYSDRSNLITRNMPNKNHSMIFNNLNENKNAFNNSLINNKREINNLVYSPKKAIYRVHSQENVKPKQIEEDNPNQVSNLIYKYRSVKDLNNLTYSKKQYLFNKRNHNDYQKYGIIDISDNSPAKNSDSKLNKKIYNIKTVRDNMSNFLDDKYQMESYVYPEIKINLKAKRCKKTKNNSVIIEHNNYDINENEDYMIENNYEKKLSSIHEKFNKNNDLKNNNSNKNMNCSSYLSNINKSIGPSNMSFISLSDTNFNSYLNIDMIPNKNLKTNLNDKALSMNDLYYILVFEEKIKDIFNILLLGKTDFINNYCFELINYFSIFSIDNYIKNIINDKIDFKNINIFNNYILFSIIILYELSYNKNIFNSVEIIAKDILKLIYYNLIIVIKYTNNILKNLEKQENKYIFELYDIINNILNRYINNKELYIKDNEYSLVNQNNDFSNEDKFYSNINYIIRNIHTIINNVKNTNNFNHILNILNMINNMKIEEINLLFRTKIMKINILSSSLKASVILKSNYQNKKKRIITPYITNINNKKYTLIMSLDDTIIHFKTNTIINNKGIMQIRPGLIEFFQNIKSYYEIIIFSSSNKKYTDAIIDSIDDKNKYIDYRLYQEHCIIINDDFVKDLSKIGRPIDKMAIVDNIPQNYRLQAENGINIKSFYGDNPNDKVLYHLSKILINIAQNGGDIRKSIKKYWNDIIYKVCSNIYNNYYK